MLRISFLLFFTSFAAGAYEWPTSSPEAVNMDSSAIDAAIEQIETDNLGNIRSLVIIKDGQLITEKYFNNSGEKRPIYSVTKSIGSALLGIAQYKGADIDLNESIMTYLPNYNNILNFNQANNITLKDLLSQRHGYNWDEWTLPYSNSNNPVAQMLRTSDWFRFALQYQISFAPDQYFAYSTGHSSVMSPILNNRTGRDVYEFAQTELFSKLGITDTHWELIDGGGTQGQGITNFPFGLEPLGFGLWIKPIDLAKIGELYRLDGIWQGERLVSKDWIDQSVQRYSTNTSDPDVFTNEFSGYGLQWWVLRLNDQDGRPFDMYYADGYGRQFIFVIPDYDAVIISTADDFNYDGPGIGTVMRENLLAAFKNNPQTIPITNDINGSWYWPENSGQGVNIEVLNENSRIIGYWYTYDSVNNAQRWFTFSGEISGNGNADFTIYTTSGGDFVISEPPEIITWGHGSFKAFSCAEAIFEFHSDIETLTVNEMPLTRLSASTGSCVEAKNNIGIKKGTYLK